MEGLAISLASLDEEEQLKAINRLLKRDLPVRQVRGFEVDPSAARPGRRGVRVGGRSSRPGRSADGSHQARSGSRVASRR
jgi:hypothetical protein